MNDGKIHPSNYTPEEREKKIKDAHAAAQRSVDKILDGIEEKKPYAIDSSPEKDTFEFYQQYKEFKAKKEASVWSTDEYVCEPAPVDTSDKIRLLLDRLDCLGNTLADVKCFIDGERPKTPEYATPGSLLHALIIMDIQLEFVMKVAEDIRMNVR